MSSAGRSEARQPGDFYETPAWCVDRLLERVHLPCGGRWLDPSAGRGSIIQAARRSRPGVGFSAVEVDPAHAQDLAPIAAPVVIGDFLTSDMVQLGCADISTVIGNPPYSLAFEFIERARAVAPHAFIAYLLRLNFLASDRRASFMRDHSPDVYVLPDRPSFRQTQKVVVDEDGKEHVRTTSSDSTEYAWMVWHPVAGAAAAPLRRTGALEVLESTPRQVRKARAQAA